MKTQITTAGLALFLAVAAAGQQHVNPCPSSTVGMNPYDAIYPQAQSAIPSIFSDASHNRPGLMDNDCESTGDPWIHMPDQQNRKGVAGTTVSLSELYHKIPAQAWKEDGKGLKAIRKGQDQIALEHFEKAVNIDPNFVAARNDLGVAHANLGHLEQAADQFRKVIDLAPDHTRATSNLSVILLKLKEYREAGLMARRALKIDPGDVQTRYILGVTLFFENGDNNETLYQLRRTVAEFPRARLMTSEILAETGRRDEAVHELEQYLRSIPPGEPNRQAIEARLAELRH